MPVVSPHISIFSDDPEECCSSLWAGHYIMRIEESGKDHLMGVLILPQNICEGGRERGREGEGGREEWEGGEGGR